MIARMIIQDVRKSTTRTQLVGHIEEAEKLDPECAHFVRAAVKARMTDLGMVDIVFGADPGGWVLRLLRVGDLSADIRFYIPSRDDSVSDGSVMEAWCLWQDSRVRDRDDHGIKVNVGNRHFD